jgi:hypothetical protein
VAFLWLFLLGGCKREEIRVYFAPKDAVAQTTAQQGQPHIHYQLPGGWTDLGPSGMRAARFSVPAQPGGDIDVSVIALPGISAGRLDIVNLWREQVRLPKMGEQEIAATAEPVQIAGKQGELFDMVSTEPLIEDKYQARILVAMVKDGDVSWFMKMTGEQQAVAGRKSQFVEFLKSITFDYSGHDSAPEFTANPTPPSSVNAKPAWTVPPHWKEVPPTEMLLAKFFVAGQGEDTAEVTVSVFPGDVGGPHANINRWRRQIGLPELDEQGTKQLVEPLNAGTGEAMLVDMRGTTTRLIGAIVPDGSRTWFYKMMGSPSVAEAEKAALVRLIQSAKHTNGG